MAKHRAMKKVSNPSCSRRNPNPPADPQRGRMETEGDSIHPFVACYQAGRMLNRLDWHLQQAWLLPTLNRREAWNNRCNADSILTKLTATLKPALSALEANSLEEKLLDFTFRWRELWSKPGHFDEIEDVSSFLQNELESLNEDSSETRYGMRVQFWQSELEQVQVIFSEVFQATSTTLDESCQEALLLGLWFDRGVRPRNVYRYMCLDPCTPSSQAASKVSHNCRDIRQLIRPFLNEIEYSIPVLQPVVEGSIPPEREWLDQLRQRWESVRLPMPMFENIASTVEIVIESNSYAAICSHIESLDEQICGELADLLPRVKCSAPLN